MGWGGEGKVGYGSSDVGRSRGSVGGWLVLVNEESAGEGGGMWSSFGYVTVIGKAVEGHDFEDRDNDDDAEKDDDDDKDSDDDNNDIVDWEEPKRATQNTVTCRLQDLPLNCSVLRRRAWILTFNIYVPGCTRMVIAYRISIEGTGKQEEKNEGEA
ncbi:hypothetical protein KSS87_019258 [Heliosperma pusillum]|nr:hypothetical protein KSS87_019258 [Heliosperma pusillum]